MSGSLGGCFRTGIVFLLPDIRTTAEALVCAVCRTYVQRQKLWFVQYLTYPENCSQAVARLIRLIDGWQVWENGKDDIPEPPVRRSRQTTGKKRSEPVSPWMLLSN